MLAVRLDQDCEWLLSIVSEAEGHSGQGQSSYTPQCPVCGIRRIMQNHLLPFVPDFSECCIGARPFRPVTPLLVKAIVCSSILSEHIYAFGCQKIRDDVIESTEVPVCSTTAGE